MYAGLRDCNVKIDYAGTYLSGYAGEKRGQMWGMGGKAANLTKKHGLLLYEDIDSTAGQSGSPLFVHQKRDRFFKASLPLICIGIHTGGSTVIGKNWSVHLDKDMRNWIKEIVTQNSKRIDFVLLFEDQKDAEEGKTTFINNKIVH